MTTSLISPDSMPMTYMRLPVGERIKTTLTFLAQVIKEEMPDGTQCSICVDHLLDKNGDVVHAEIPGALLRDSEQLSIAELNHRHERMEDIPPAHFRRTVEEAAARNTEITTVRYVILALMEVPTSATD